MMASRYRQFVGAAAAITWMLLWMLLGSCLALAQARDTSAITQEGVRREASEWVTGGGDWTGGYFSALTKINDSNAAQLGFAWDYELNSTRGQEATPLMMDGVMYTSTNWGRVVAVDAATGREKWRFDPEVNGLTGRNMCCDVVNRGVSFYDGKIYVGAFDGRLIALDARTGKSLWQVDTLIDHRKMYSITGAPQVAGKVVVIGNAGADFWTRGYVTAYDLQTGKQKWRFFTVPGDPSKGFEHPEMEVASKTWDPHSQWELGGGGNAWDGMAYDPALNLLYVGTGNSGPYDRTRRSPSGGDNLYLASILAINPDTGRLRWHYQETPKENWDFTATAKMILADLTINGKPRKVLMHAPKNGFFYVLDRSTGELLSAKNYTFVNWASGVDMKTGRPVETANAVWQTGPKLLFPSAYGGHSWQPMAFSPNTGLVYIPVIESPMIVLDMTKTGKNIKSIDGQYSMGFVFPKDYNPVDWEPVFGKLPLLQEFSNQPKGREIVGNRLRAWDPVAQRSVWEQQTSSEINPEGGVMVTAGNLVVQGRSTGVLWIYAADSGKVLSKIDTGTGLMAAPMTYEVNGEQFISVMGGMGGSTMYWPWPASSAPYKYQNKARILTFKLGGGPVPKPPPVVDQPFPAPPAQLADVTSATLQEGSDLYNVHCGRCHLMGRGMLPDLRRLTPAKHEIFNDIVLKGILGPLGMGKFDDTLDQRQVNAVHAFLIQEQRSAYEAQSKTASR